MLDMFWTKRILSNYLALESKCNKISSIIRDVLLLLHGNVEDCREYIPSKAYEYFWAGRPIIALTYKNPQLDRMLSGRSSYVAASDRQSEIVGMIKKAFDDWKADRLPQSLPSGVGVGQAVDAILKALDR